MRWLADLFGFWFISSFFLLPLSLFVGITVLLPGTMFKLPVLLTFISAPFVVAYAISSINPRQSKGGVRRRVSRKTFAIIWVGLALVLIGFYTFQTLDEAQHLKNANNEFVVSQADPIGKGRIDTTLVELDRQFMKLSEAYGPIPHPEGMSIVLYNTVQSLQSKSKMQEWADAYFSYRAGKAEIHLPAEQTNTGSGNSKALVSSRPGHEIGHYVIFQIVGEQHAGQIPLWFNEGLVQYESLKGWDINRIWERDIIGIGLWLYNISNPALLNDGRFLFQNTMYPNEHVDVFYAASMEFVRYVAEHYGGLRNVLERVANGEAFVYAFQEETGRNYQEAYGQWHLAFFGY
jgi:hypothetical protein